MERRTLIRASLTVAATLPVPGLRAWARTLAFPGGQEDTLAELAAAVLPSSLGRQGTDAAARAFATWIRGYRAGAALSPGYGSPRLRYTGPSPAPLYERQLAALAAGALAAPDPAERRRLIAAELEALAIDDLPGVHRGRHVASDLVAFWCSTPDAHDLAYRAAIGKDLCRGLASSGQQPRPLGEG